MAGGSSNLAAMARRARENAGVARDGPGDRARGGSRAACPVSLLAGGRRDREEKSRLRWKASHSRGPTSRLRRGVAIVQVAPGLEGALGASEIKAGDGARMGVSGSREASGKR